MVRKLHFKMSEIQGPKIPKIRLINFETLIRDQYPSQNMKWKFGNMGSTSSKNIKWNYATLNLWSQGTKNYETKNNKPRNQATKTL